MAQSAPSRHWDTTPPPTMYSDTPQADSSYSDVAMDGNKHKDTVEKLVRLRYGRNEWGTHRNYKPGAERGSRREIRALWEACGNGSNLEMALESQGKIFLWMGLEDGILRLGCGRDAGLRNLLKLGTEDGVVWREVRAGWRRIDDGGGKEGKMNMAEFEVRCVGALISESDDDHDNELDGLREILEVPQVQFEYSTTLLVVHWIPDLT
ncbi:hypothetical protein B0H13DRAFT_1886984 [Mycena leptocephala]|nr:hypothetical protein B0H13DRAFT_1886984 [Mycena leptocephala]